MILRARGKVATASTAPLLSQVPSQALANWAGERPQWPQSQGDLDTQHASILGPKAVLSPRILRYLFFGLTIFSIVGLSGSLYAIVDSGEIEPVDALTVISAFLLSLATYSQLRGLTAGTRAERLLALPSRLRRRASSEAAPPPLYVAPLLNQAHVVSEGQIQLMETRRAAQALRISHRAMRRALPFLVLGIGGLSIAVTGYVFYRTALDSLLDPDSLLSGCVLILAIYGFVQFGRFLARSGWRASAFQVARRVYYDSLRLYSNSSILAQLGSASAATAVVVSAGLAPIVFPADPGFVVLGYSTQDGVVYRIDPYTQAETPLTEPVGGATASSPLVFIPGSLARELQGSGSLQALQVVNNRQGSEIVLIDPSSGARHPVRRLSQTVEAVGVVLQADHSLLLAEPSGGLLRADLHSGEVTSVGNLGVPLEGLAHDASRPELLAVSEGSILIIDEKSYAVKSESPVAELAGASVCGISAIGRHVLVADTSASEIVGVALNRAGKSKVNGTIGPSRLPQPVCGIAAVPR